MHERLRHGFNLFFVLIPLVIGRHGLSWLEAASFPTLGGRAALRAQVCVLVCPHAGRHEHRERHGLVSAWCILRALLAGRAFVQSRVRVLMLVVVRIEKGVICCVHGPGNLACNFLPGALVQRGTVYDISCFWS